MVGNHNQNDYEYENEHACLRLNYCDCSELATFQVNTLEDLIMLDFLEYRETFDDNVHSKSSAYTGCITKRTAH